MEQSPDSSGSFDWADVAPGAEHFAVALEAYQTGSTFPEIVSMLEARGLSLALIPDITTALAQDRALHHFSVGKSLSEVTRVLTERGLSPEDAKLIAGSVAQARDKAYGLGKWPIRLLVTGGLLLVAGLTVFAVGHLGGREVPTELIAGLLGFGGALASLGFGFIAYSAGWRWEN